MAEKTKWEILESITARDLIYGGLPSRSSIVGAGVETDMEGVKRECLHMMWIEEAQNGGSTRKANFYFDRDQLKWIYIGDHVMHR